MIYRIERVKANEDSFEVLLNDGTWFEIARPDLSDINTTISFQEELLSQGIHLVEVVEVMANLMAGVLLSLEKIPGAYKS